MRVAVLQRAWRTIGLQEEPEPCTPDPLRRSCACSTAWAADTSGTTARRAPVRNGLGRSHAGHATAAARFRGRVGLDRVRASKPWRRSDTVAGTAALGRPRRQAGLSRHGAAAQGDAAAARSRSRSRLRSIASTSGCYGNNWAWAPDPTTPQVEIRLRPAECRRGRALAVTLDRVRWQEWWLLHRRLTRRNSSRCWAIARASWRSRSSAAEHERPRALLRQSGCVSRRRCRRLTFQPRPRPAFDCPTGRPPARIPGRARCPFPPAKRPSCRTMERASSRPSAPGDGRRRVCVSVPRRRRRARVSLPTAHRAR